MTNPMTSSSKGAKMEVKDGGAPAPNLPWSVAVPSVANGATLVIVCTLQGGEISSKEPRRPDLT